MSIKIDYDGDERVLSVYCDVCNKCYDYCFSMTGVSIMVLTFEAEIHKDIYKSIKEPWKTCTINDTVSIACSDECNAELCKCNNI